MNREKQAVENFFKSFVETYLVERNKEKVMAFFQRMLSAWGQENLK